MTPAATDWHPGEALNRLRLPIITVMAFSLSACGGSSEDTSTTVEGIAGSEASSTSTTSVTTTVSTPPTSTPEATEAPDQGILGTMVRFSAGSTVVELTIDEDNPAIRDFLSMLPLTLTLEEFNGREKIAYLPRDLAHEGSPGSDPEDGDLIYYIPWGNIGFYYHTDGIDYSDQTIHLGTYDAPLDVLEQLEAQEVTVEIVP
jgi:hypothetical protein